MIDSLLTYLHIPQYIKDLLHLNAKEEWSWDISNPAGVEKFRAESAEISHHKDTEICKKSGQVSIKPVAAHQSVSSQLNGAKQSMEKVEVQWPAGCSAVRRNSTETELAVKIVDGWGDLFTIASGDNSDSSTEEQ